MYNIIRASPINYFISRMLYQYKSCDIVSRLPCEKVVGGAITYRHMDGFLVSTTSRLFLRLIKHTAVNILKTKQKF